MQYSFDVADEDAYVDLESDPESLSHEVYERAVQDIFKASEQSGGDGSRQDPYFGTVLVIESKVVDRKRVRVVHPLILYPYRTQGGEVRIDWAMPAINGAAIAILDNLEIASAVAGAEELTQSLRESIEETAGRPDEMGWLADAKPHWLRSVNSEGTYKPVAEIVSSGVYLQNVLCLVEQSPYTKSLESELIELPSLSGLEKTALGALVGGDRSNLTTATTNSGGEVNNLLEILPSNAEQADAIGRSLENKLTVIQGPPGTGKSQVIAQAIMNAVHSNQTVLFVSKNNQAVDVVERRINEMSDQPVLLRLRSGNIKHQIADYLDFYFNPAGGSTRSYFLLLRLISRLQVKSRKASESVEGYNNLRSWLVESGDVSDLNAASERGGQVRVVQGIPTKLIRRAIHLLTQDRQRAKVSKFTKAYRAFSSIELNLYVYVLKRRGLKFKGEDWEVQLGGLLEFEDVRRRVIDYRERLGRYNLVDRISHESAIKNKTRLHTVDYWKAYVGTRPGRLSDEARLKLEEFKVSTRLSRSKDSFAQILSELFNSIANSGGDSPFPAWSTTLLSLKRTTPLKVGMFDVVIFDEASQCDIASALPALARARRAVVIGDPKQLSHITPHTSEHELSLMRSYGLGGRNKRWSYTQNSLFDLVHSSVTVSSINLLRDHHRSHEDIIGFSNKFFYGGMLRTKTDSSRLKLPESERGVVWDDTGTSRVEKPKSGSVRNIKEARRVVRVLEGLIGKYPEVSIGIITPFRAQADYIRELIGQSFQDEVQKRLSLRVGTVHTFQGDEKDIVIFSPVVAEGMTEGQMRFIAQAGNLFNVAMTRARSKLIVVGDLLFARTNQILFYSSFVEYVVELDRQRSHGKGKALRCAPLSKSMKTVLRCASDSLLVKLSDGSVFSSSVKVLSSGVSDFELVRYAAGDREIYVMLDNMTRVMTAEKFMALRDVISDLVGKGYSVVSLTSWEIDRDAEVLARKLDEAWSKAIDKTTH